jgi:hypothetical protein
MIAAAVCTRTARADRFGLSAFAALKSYLKTE